MNDFTARGYSKVRGGQRRSATRNAPDHLRSVAEAGGTASIRAISNLTVRAALGRLSALSVSL
jgi:hypothetical protein